MGDELAIIDSTVAMEYEYIQYTTVQGLDYNAYCTVG